MKFFYMALMSTLVLAGCATDKLEDAAVASLPDHIKLTCDDESKVAVQFVDDTAIVTAPDGKTPTLKQYYNEGSNRWYTLGIYDLRIIDSKEALWSMGRRATTECTFEPA